MKKNNNKKEQKNYGKLLHKDAKIILIMMIVSILFEVYLEATSNYDYLILFILYIAALCQNKTEKKKSLGILMIIASILIIIESVIDFSSLFNLIFLILGTLSMYHSIRYLKK